MLSLAVSCRVALTTIDANDKTMMIHPCHGTNSIRVDSQPTKYKIRESCLDNWTVSAETKVNQTEKKEEINEGVAAVKESGPFYFAGLLSDVSE